MSEDGDLAALIARCALRDRHAFARLYQNSAARLYAVALRIVRRHDWAEDILQESFISIWNHITEYSAQKSAPMTWMTTIVRNRALDWLRRPDVERGSEDYDVLVQTIPDQAFGPGERLQTDRTTRALSECMETLSAQQRQSLALAYVHGLSHVQLAAHLREPLGTVKTWVRRGLERLRDCLEIKGESIS
ncbi:MAG: sigma-70 family RNA polymerase sigma factor [Burkholderiales bacterium]|nr:sigma-70 family RNA polymerase sigma factor [Burkholderiales bacterium]